jgi:mitochondrial fission protein ELM1
VLAVLGALGLVDEEQRAVLTEQAPILFTALGTVIAVGMGIYRNRTKASSDKAAEVAKEVDAKIPKADPVIVQTPGLQPNIVVAGDP